MKAHRAVRLLAGALLLVAAGCRSISVDPEPSPWTRTAPAQRPPLDFGLEWRWRRPLADPDEAGLDGEDLAAVSDQLRAALASTAAFGDITRASAGRGLHCAFRVQVEHVLSDSYLVSGLLLGMVPFWNREVLLAEVTASAPWRPAQTYSVCCRAETMTWTPLLPVALVQALTQTPPLGRAVDALVSQVAADGWLSPPPASAR